MPETVSASLPVTSSGASRNKAVPTKSDLKKKAKQQKDLEINLNLLLPDSKAVQEEKAFNFAQAYFLKARDKLDNSVFSQFIEILSSFDAQNSSVIELYTQIMPILQACPELSEEFLAFLLPEQAMEVGRYMDYLYITKVKDFFRKLEVYFAKQPHQMRKIYEGLARLSEQPGVALENVRSTILPLLKSSPLLTDHFLQLFPGERPPSANCSQTEFEKLVNIENSADLAKNNDWEVIKIPDLEDPFGGNRCPCECHRDCSTLHCINCSLKFIKGRVFIQKGKVLRLAKLVFEGADRKEVLERIGKKVILNQEFYKVRPRKRAADSSPLKNSHSSSGTEADDDPSDNPTAPKIAKVKPIKILKTKIGLTSVKNRGEGDFKIISSEEEPVNYDSYVILQDIKHGCNETEEEQLDRLMELHEQDKVDLELSGGHHNEDDDKNSNDSSENYDFREGVNGEAIVIDGQNLHEIFSPDSNIKVEEFSFGELSLPKVSEESNVLGKDNIVVESKRQENECSTDVNDLSRTSVSSEVEVKSSLPDQRNTVKICDLDGSDNRTIRDFCNDYLKIDSKEPKANDSCIFEEAVVKASKQNECERLTDVYDPNDTVISFEVEVISDVEKQPANVNVECDLEMNTAETCCLLSSEPGKSNDVETKDSSLASVENMKVDEIIHEEPSVKDEIDVYDVIIRCEEPDTISGCEVEGTGSEKQEEAVDGESTSWTREEDKVILQTFQQEGDSGQTFIKIAGILPSRTVSEIQSRFQVLMQLLKQMACVSKQI